VTAPEGGNRGRSKEEMGNAMEGGVEAEDITMVESTTPTTTATPVILAMGTGRIAETGIEPRNRTGVAALNVQSDHIQLRKVICMGHGRAEDGGGMEDGCGVSVRAIKWKCRM
jgi:hypothetical protein